MAAGTPVLISEAPALVEVAGGAALSVPLTELVDGLRQVLDDEALRARLRTAGPRRAADFSWQRSAEILWRAYAPTPETGGDRRRVEGGIDRLEETARERRWASRPRRRDGSPR